MTKAAFSPLSVHFPVASSLHRLETATLGGVPGATKSKVSPPEPRFSQVAWSISHSLSWLMSAFMVVLSVMVGLSLAHAAQQPQPPELALSSAISGKAFLASLLFALGAPLVLAWWKYGPDPRAIFETMSWLVALCNGFALALGALVMPELMAKAFRSSDEVVAEVIGTQNSLTQATSALGQEAALHLSPQQDPRNQPRLTREIARDEAHRENIALGREGNGVFVEVELFGPKQHLKQKYLFDTGASYTTITRQQARQLGIDIPPDAPRLDFNTAAGTRSSPMVFLPRLRIGNYDIDGLLVSVCDTCATDRYPGLLGINVMREFHVELDYQDRHMRLIPRVYDGPANRFYDIEPLLELSIEGRPEVWMHNIRWTAKIRNRGTVPVHNVIAQVEFGGEQSVLSEAIATIGPGQTQKTLIRGRLKRKARGPMEFTLSLAHAEW